jgi:hypothetical protein
MGWPFSTPIYKPTSIVGVTVIMFHQKSACAPSNAPHPAKRYDITAPDGPFGVLKVRIGN